MKKIVTVIGTRPEIIKMFPIINQLDKTFNHTLILSGQHFSKNMVHNIFKDIGLRKPDYIINIKKKRNYQFFELQEKIFKLVKKINPSAVVYHGDTLTTTAISSSLYIYLNNIKKIHIEGGYRSTDKNQSEERLRYISDHMSDLIFVQRNNDKLNLKKEGVSKNVFVVGNSINDSIKEILNKKKQKLSCDHVLCTIHRQENVNNLRRFTKIIDLINYIAKTKKIIFSVHPRTKKMIKEKNLRISKNVKIIEPVNYSILISLIEDSSFVISDSGGIQEEAVILKKQCIVPLNFTPHNYYVSPNANIIVNLDKKNYLRKVKNFLKNYKKNKKFKYFNHPKNVSEKIVKIIKKNI
jgi:UDP-N-acetylglucosamine 2-epimerase